MSEKTEPTNKLVEKVRRVREKTNKPDPAAVVPTVVPMSAPVMPVTLTAEANPVATSAQETESALTSLGQRHINAMWERTQQVVAISVTVVTLMVCSFLVWRGDDSTGVPAFLLLSNVFFLVIGTYFQRSNHVKTGGVGPGEVGR